MVKGAGCCTTPEAKTKVLKKNWIGHGKFHLCLQEAYLHYTVLMLCIIQTSAYIVKKVLICHYTPVLATVKPILGSD